MLNELALFAGAGGGILGGKLLGWRTVCAVELDAFCRGVLLARQNDHSLEPFPIWDDVRTFDGIPWRGIASVVSAGFPCQDISESNSRAVGITGARSGLWIEAARIIREVQPRCVLVENSPLLNRRGLGQVLDDLAAMGFDAKWGTVGGLHAGRPIRRLRTWIVAALPDGLGWEGSGLDEGWTPASRSEIEARGEEFQRLVRHVLQSAVPAGNTGRVSDGIPNRMDRLAAIGNAQSPTVAELSWKVLTQ